MSLVIAIAVFVILSIEIPLIQRKNKGNAVAYKRMEKAKKRNDMETAILVSKRLVYGRNKRTTNVNEYHCEYLYKVNGKEYTFKYCTVSEPPKTMLIYYDRDNGYKRIDLEEESQIEKVLRYIPLIVAIIVFIVLNSIL